MVRAKFYVSEVNVEQGRVSLSPVTSGSPENERYFKLTPGGQIVLQTINEEAVKQFGEYGKEFYVDFTPAG